MVPRLPLAIVEAAVVAGAEDAVAGGELDAVVEAKPVAAEPAFAVEEGAGDGVELGDVGAAVGDHRAAGEVAAGGLPPVGDQLRLRLDPIGGDGQPAVLGGVGEVVAAAAVAEQRERAPFELVALAAVVVQLDRAVALDDRAEEAAGPDGGKLGRVADEHRLALGRSTWKRARVRVRVSAIAASSTTSRQPRGRPPRCRASARRRWRVPPGMPVSAARFAAATPEGAAPIATWPSRW